MAREELLERVLSAVPDLVTVTDRDLRIVYASAAACAWFRRDPDAVVGNTWRELVPASDVLDTWEKDLKEVLATGRTVSYDSPDIDGVRHWNIDMSPIPGPGGEVEYVLANAHEVTERWLVEQRLREVTEQLESIIAAAPIAIVLIDLDGTVRLWSPGAEMVFGWSAEEALGQRAPFVPAGREDEFRRLLGLVAEGRVMTGLEVVRQRKGGEPVDVSLSVAPLRDAAGRITGALGLFVDITERRRAAEELERARRDAEAASQAKSDFLSRMSHELRTPLNAVLGFAQLLEMDDLRPDQRECAEQILKSGRHLLELINEILDIARIESGRLKLSPEAVPIAEVMTECVDLVRPMAAEREIAISCEVPNLDICALADRQRLKQVLLNLLSNAIKFNRDRGAVRLGGVVSGEIVKVHVRDTGRGIPQDLIGRLFRPFERLEAEGTRVEGTGLGLAVSLGLVRAMGGEIDVDSAPGEGSTFTVRLNRTVFPVQGAETAPARPQGESRAEGGLRTILYVEDNLPNLRLMERVIAGRGDMQLVSAGQGRLALELARMRRPDLVLLDLHLPDMPGDLVLERLLVEPATRNIPIVIVSADATQRQVDRLLRAGARDYLTKPIDIARLMRLLDELSGGAAPPSPPHA